MAWAWSGVTYSQVGGWGIKEVYTPTRKTQSKTQGNLDFSFGLIKVHFRWEKSTENE